MWLGLTVVTAAYLLGSAARGGRGARRRVEGARGGSAAWGAGLVGLCFALAACGGAQRGASDAAADARRAAEARAPTVERASGAGTLAVPRATEGAVVLAVFVDAGSRDADPPQLATAAAWLAAGRSPGVRARVEPDGTEWSVDCTRARLAECAAQLAGVLALRDADDAELVRVRAALADARRRALSDDARTADALALSAALGDGDAGALGAADDDARVNAAALSRFTQAHYGPTRALFVAAGDVGGDALRAAITTAMRGAPAASAVRAERPAAGDASRAGGAAAREVRVEVSESNAVSVALRVGSAGRARAIAARLVADTRAAADEVRGFGLRGAGVVLVRGGAPPGAASDVGAEVTRLSALLETARRETPDDAAVPASAPDALDELARGYGRAFVTGEPPPGAATPSAPATRDAALAVGVVVRGGRAPTRRERDPDARLLQDTLAAVTLARAQALAAAAPDLRGAVTPRAASVALPNGARVEVRALPGAATLALAVRFASDAASEPMSVLGRTALAAEALVDACAGSADRDGVTLTALVDAHSLGLLATARAHADDDLDALLRALRCALEATPGDAALEDARHTLSASLDPRLDPASHARALAALALAPETPAALAFRGDGERVAAVPAGEVRALLDDARRGARVAVALAGDLDTAEAAARLGRRLSTLAPGALAAPRPLASADADDVLAARWPGPGVRVVVTLRADAASLGSASAGSASAGSAPDPLDARAFALALGARLAAAPGVRLASADGDVSAAGALAWVALDLDEDALAALPANVALANAALGAGVVSEPAVRAVRARLAEQRAASLASPAVVAAALSAARVEGRPPVLTPGDGAALPAVLDALASARPRYVIARPGAR